MPPVYVDVTQANGKGNDNEPCTAPKLTYEAVNKASEFPQNSETQDMSFKPAAIPSPAGKPNLHKLPADIPASELHASVKSAMQLAAENYF